MIFVGFGVLGALYPLHTWSPDGHSSAPTAVSMLHAGVLMKLGGYGALRIAVYLLPEGAKMWGLFFMALTTINILYGSFGAIMQKDLKYFTAYSSVSHCGFVLFGVAALNLMALKGAVHPDVQPRHHDGPVLRPDRHGLWPDAHAHHRRDGRPGQEDALAGDDVLYRRSGQSGSAGPVGIRRRDPCVPGRLLRQRLDERDGDAGPDDPCHDVDRRDGRVCASRPGARSSTAPSRNSHFEHLDDATLPERISTGVLAAVLVVVGLAPWSSSI